MQSNKKAKSLVLKLEYDYDFTGGDGENGTLNHCCGVFEIGGFNTIEAIREDLVEQRYDFVDDLESELEEGEANPYTVPELTEEDIIRVTKDYVQGEMQEQGPQKAFIATTVSTQSHAIAALTELGFTPTLVTSRVTLWVKRGRLRA